jgi:hypothetical protein
VAALNALETPPPTVLEINSKLPDEFSTLPERIRQAFDLLD